MSKPDRQLAASNVEPLPIWMAALLATTCHALGHEGARKVEWQCVSGRAIYTNAGDGVEVLLPFGFPVRGGQTVAVTWTPGDTSYTIRVEDSECLAA
jgi:hypothetical protein